MKFLGSHAEALLFLSTSPIIRRGPATDEQETEKETNGPNAYDSNHDDGGPIQQPCCPSVENSSVEEHDAELNEA